jgi:hypothetical protein
MASPIVNNVPISSIYEQHHKSNYYVNRDYQRKLVWEHIEKSKFIESLLMGFPVPLVLLAKVSSMDNQLEIVDGLQRLEAIIAFLESRFSVKGKFFDLRRDARTKQLLEQGKLTQRQPLLDEESCIRLLKYELPVSVFEVDNLRKITRVFQRINSYGKRLSRQELRFSSSSARFSKLVSRIAMNTRGDASGTIVPIGDMCKYSISNKNLDYGIRAKSIPWCQTGVLSHSDIRESRDEEMIGHLLAYQLLGKKVPPSGTALDRIYGMSRLSTNDDLYKLADDEIEKLGPEKVENQFLHVFDELRKTISSSSEQHFARLVFGGNSHRVKWHYQATFIAFFELIIQNRKQVADYIKLGDSLRRCAAATGICEDWTGDVRYAAKEAIRSRIQHYFIDRGSEDPAIHSNHTKLENLLSYSKSEQEYYEFKIGFHRLDLSSTFDEGSLDKIIRTISAMANHGPKATGRVLLGIADNEDDARKWSSKYSKKYIQVCEHFVTGVDQEAKSYGGIDKYREFIKHRIDNSPITPATMKKCIRIESWTYKGKEVLVLQVDSVSDATFYDNKLYVRQDSRLQELKPEEYGIVFRRFFMG